MLSEKNLYILLLYINFSKIFSKLDKSEIGWWFEKSSLESYLCTGITLEVLSIEGKTPEEKVILNISDSWLEMSFLSNFNILIGILLGPTDLLESNDDMIFFISVLSVGGIEKEVLDLFLRKPEKCLCENEY